VQQPPLNQLHPLNRLGVGIAVGASVMAV
jgi:hypothetical protein